MGSVGGAASASSSATFGGMGNVPASANASGGPGAVADSAIQGGGEVDCIRLRTPETDPTAVITVTSPATIELRIP